MLKTYLDKNFELTIKHASLTWGDCSFTVMATNTIDSLSQVNGFLGTGGGLSNAGKELVLEQMHSKFLGHQVLELLAELARQAIKQHSKLYTWTSVNGREEEVDGLTFLALILARI